MRRWTRILAAAVVRLARAAWTARFLWQRTTAAAVQRLRLDAGSGAPDSPDLLAGLPAPAARYFEFALTPGQRRVRAARPGFLWDAGIRMLPLVPVLVRDSYWRGQGAMLGKVLGAVTGMDSAGAREMAEASLLGWLAQAAWPPTALLPRPGLRGEAAGEGRAKGMLEDSGVRVSLNWSSGSGARRGGFRLCPTGTETAKPCSPPGPAASVGTREYPA